MDIEIRVNLKKGESFTLKRIDANSIKIISSDSPIKLTCTKFTNDEEKEPTKPPISNLPYWPPGVKGLTIPEPTTVPCSDQTIVDGPITPDPIKDPDI